MLCEPLRAGTKRRTPQAAAWGGEPRRSADPPSEPGGRFYNANGRADGPPTIRSPSAVPQDERERGAHFSTPSARKSHFLIGAMRLGISWPQRFSRAANAHRMRLDYSDPPASKGCPVVRAWRRLDAPGPRGKTPARGCPREGRQARHAPPVSGMPLVACSRLRPSGFAKVLFSSEPGGGLSQAPPRAGGRRRSPGFRRAAMRQAFLRGLAAYRVLRPTLLDAHPRTYLPDLSLWCAGLSPQGLTPCGFARLP